MNGRAFDAQVVLSPPDSTRGKLLQQYVCVRLVRMDGVDLGLFDFDRHNALYFFILNADEQIYLRYGGRDAESATTYLNLRSLELALAEGLEMHAKGAAPNAPRPPSWYATDIPLLKQRTAWQGRCVECHLIADYENLQKESKGTLDRPQDMYRSPDIKKLGIYLDIPAGLVIKESKGAVASAGLRAGDTITHLNEQRVRTFGDLQYCYDNVARDAEQITLGILRDQTPQTLTIPLPTGWWVSDLAYRHWTVEPLVHFTSQPLTAQQKSEHAFSPAGFAAEVVDVDRFFISASPPLKRRDIIYGVDEVFEDELADTPELHIKLRHRAGSKVKLHVLRGTERFISTLMTERQSFRKTEP